MIHHQISSTVPETRKSPYHKFQNFEKFRHALFSTVCECSEQTQIWPGGHCMQQQSPIEGDRIYTLDPPNREHEDSQRERKEEREKEGRKEREGEKEKGLCLSAAND